MHVFSELQAVASLLLLEGLLEVASFFVEAFVSEEEGEESDEDDELPADELSSFFFWVVGWLKRDFPYSVE